MRLSSDEQLVLGGILRFALRFDGLSTEARAEALARAGDALGVRAEREQRSAAPNAGYRDAAIITRTVTNELDAYLARAQRELADDAALRRAIDRVTSPDVRLGCVITVETLARFADDAHPPAAGRRSRSDLFVDWLREHWALGPSD